MDLQETADIFPQTLQLPTFSRAGDQIDFTFYDRLVLDNANAGTAEREFFANGINDTDPITGNRKTLADTNKRGRQNPEGQAFGLFVLRARWQGAAAKTSALYQNMLDYIQEAVVEFQIESKNQYGTWVLDELFDLPIENVMDNGAGDFTVPASVGITQGKKPLNLYIPLARLVEWSINMITLEASNANIDGDAIKIECVGILNRRA